MQRFLPLDQQLSASLTIPQDARALRWGAVLLAHTGDSPLWITLGAATLVWGRNGWHVLGIRMLVGSLSAGLVTLGLKKLFRRRRPTGKGRGFYAPWDRHAFPSGHAGRTACMVTLLLPFFPPWGRALLTIWAGLVGVARVALQIHFASDIIAGWIVGLLVGLALGPYLR